MKRRFVLFVAVLAVSAHALGIVITELHRDPAAGNKTAIPGGYSHVFVELTNFGNDTFFLRNTFLTNGKVVDSIRLFDAPIAGHEECVFDAAYIPPGGTALILPQNYIAGLAAAPASIHPVVPGTIMLTGHNRNLGGGLANDDGVAIYIGTRTRLDSLVDLAADPDIHISAPLSGKIVLSRRQPKGISIVPASLLLGGNRQYIVAPRDPLSPGRFDGFREGIYMEHTANMISDAVRCSIAGIFVTQKSAGTVWRLYSQTANREVTEINRGVFGPERQFLLTFDIVPEQVQYFFEVGNNGQAISFPIDLSGFWAAAGTIFITEIYPKGGTQAAAGQPEWFELKNVSSAEVNLNGWMFGNSRDTAEVTSSDYILPPGAYLVVTRDSAAMRARYRGIEYMIRPARWRSLNSNNDTLSVWSPHGIEVDKAAYRNSWFTGWTKQSLERVFVGGYSGIDSVSWVLCDRPTPGAPGSAAIWRAVSSPSLEIGPIPFRPGGNVDEALSIRMNVPPNYRVKIRIFGFDGKLLKTFTGERELLLWDGTTDQARPAPPGAIYVIAEFTSGGTRTVIRKNGVLWR